MSNKHEEEQPKPDPSSDGHKPGPLGPQPDPGKHEKK
jgi:hypothetical protein